MNLSNTRAIVQRIAQCRDSFSAEGDHLTHRQRAIYLAATAASQPGATRQDRENLAYTLEHVIPAPVGPEAGMLMEELRHG